MDKLNHAFELLLARLVSVFHNRITIAILDFLVCSTGTAQKAAACTSTAHTTRSATPRSTVTWAVRTARASKGSACPLLSCNPASTQCSLGHACVYHLQPGLQSLPVRLGHRKNPLCVDSKGRSILKPLA